MEELIELICPACGHPFAAEEDDEAECPHCDTAFPLEDGKAVTEEEPLWWLDDDGQETTDDLPQFRCPGCVRGVQLDETNAVSVSCGHCQRTYPIPHPRVVITEPDDWDYDPYAEEEDEQTFCPACESDPETGEFEAVPSRPGWNMVRCGHCGWEWEVGEEEFPLEDEPEDDEPTPRKRVTVVVSQSGFHAHTSLAEAVRGARQASRIVLMPGVYEESAHVWSGDLEVVGRGGPGEVVILSRGQPCINLRVGRLRVRGVTFWQLAEGGRPDAAIRVEGGVAVLEDCTLTSARGTCVEVGGRHAPVHCLLRRCRLHDATGVEVTGGTVRLEECRLENARGQAVVVNKGLVTTRRCEILGGDGHGLRLEEGSLAILEDTALRDQAGCGIDADGGQVLLRRCRVERSGRHGLVVRSHGNATLLDSHIDHCTGYGAAVLSRARLTVRRSEIRECGRSGLLLRGLGILADSTLKGNGQAGLKVKGGMTHLRDCRLEQNRDSGLVLRRDGQALLIRCAFTGNQAHGARLDGGLLLDECRCLGNGGSGLFLSGSANGLLDRCLVRGNGAAGVEVGGQARPVLRQCTVAGQRRNAGVVVRRGGRARLEGSVIAQNGRAGVEARAGGGVQAFACDLASNGSVGLWVHSGGQAHIEDCALPHNGRGPWEIEAGGRVFRQGNVC